MAIERVEKGYFKKGVSANPKGRPKKGKTFPDIIEAELKRIKVEQKNKDGTERNINGKQLLVMGLINIATNSKDERVRLQAINQLMNRLEGTPTQTVENTGNVSVNVNERAREEYLSNVDPEKLDQLDDIYSEIDNENINNE